MICPKCNQVTPSGAFCTLCGASVPEQLARTANGESCPAAQGSSAPQVWKTVLLGILSAVMWGVVVALGYVQTIRWSQGIFSAEAAGYWLGTTLWPALLSLLVVWLVNRNRQHKLLTSHRRLLLASVAVLVSLVSLAASMANGSKSPSVKNEIGHLLKQATGEEATANVHWYDQPTREFFRDAVSFGQEYTAAAHSVDRTFVNKLYTPESYATRTSKEGTIAELQALLEVDKKYDSLDPLLKKLEANVAAAEASPREKQDFLTGVHSSLARSFGPRNETFRVEEEWLENSIDLYRFALSQSAHYVVRGNKLVFTEDAARVEFLQRQSKCIVLRKAVAEARNKFNTARTDAMSQLGIAPSDFPSMQQTK